MTTAVHSVTSAIDGKSRSLTRIFGLEAKYELLKALRMPAYAIPTVLFPLLFYVFFGLAFGGGRMAGGDGNRVKLASGGHLRDRAFWQPLLAGHSRSGVIRRDPVPCP